MSRFLQYFLPRRNLDRLYLFVHLPKCAGTSLLETFSGIGSQRFVVLAGKTTKREALALMQSEIARKHIGKRDLDLVMGRNVYFGMHECSPRQPFYFTFLRDPVQRYISQYSFYVKCVGDPAHRAHEMAKREILRKGKIISIQEFAERNYCSNAITRALAAASSDKEYPENSWSQVSLDDAPQKAEWMLDQMSFIGFVDQLDRDVSRMCSKLNIKPRLKHVNASESGAIHVDRATAGLIRDINRLDLQTYEKARKLARQVN